jgi:hypothetical protein
MSDDRRYALIHSTSNTDDMWTMLMHASIKMLSASWAVDVAPINRRGLALSIDVPGHQNVQAGHMMLMSATSTP